MGIKLDENKRQKREALLNTAYRLFTTKGFQKTSISDIVDNAGVGKGTFYLYFTDKDDLRTKLISHKSYDIVRSAYDAMCQAGINGFEDMIIFMTEQIVDTFEKDPALLHLISKNLSWGLFKNAVSTADSDYDESTLSLYLRLFEQSEHKIIEPEIMIFSIIEYVGSISYNTILYKQPVTLGTIKPFLFNTIRSIIRSHYAI